MSIHKNLMAKLLYDTMAQKDARKRAVFVDVDENKPVMAGTLGDLRPIKEEKPKTSSLDMDADEISQCNEIFSNLIKTFDSPEATIAKTRFAKTHDEWVPSMACANRVVNQMQWRYGQESFFRSFTAKRVQLIDEDSHGRATLYMPTTVVRIEMDK